ncbi:DUF6166 domain-containing protein [Halosimplex salinum]|uniref:DUF6166 domain-containing protein n=1 Tax=Halosimplex salinum TaxID=1710538 RepID=UPI0013DDA97A|nr:DUF6166 domain-containing protein [Halosimplex salinum]
MGLPELERSSETVYRGDREGRLVDCYRCGREDVRKKFAPDVLVDDPRNTVEYSLLPRRELSNSAPGASFQWGYSGHGPYLLAVSLVADAYDDDEVALEYQTPVEQLLKDFDQHEPWELEAVDLDDWIRTFE